MRISLILFLAMMITTDAFALIRCRVTYRPEFDREEAVTSNAVTARANVGGLNGTQTVTFRPDGVIRAATAVFQPGTNPAVGTLSLNVQLDNGSNGSDQETQYATSFPSYPRDQREPVTIKILRPAGSREFDFGNQRTKVVPLTFKGPGDFPSSAVTQLRDKVVVQVDLTCAEGLR